MIDIYIDRQTCSFYHHLQQTLSSELVLITNIFTEDEIEMQTRQLTANSAQGGNDKVKI